MHIFLNGSPRINCKKTTLACNVKTLLFKQNVIFKKSIFKQQIKFHAIVSWRSTISASTATNTAQVGKPRNFKIWPEIFLNLNLMISEIQALLKILQQCGHGHIARGRTEN